ncbi:hypothetical protein [Actinomadura rudentiformis]|uniref:Uncharacterized protein n=1 Tax=Actinomadura rudentiformis TaxID=359158 RepID=A0A6H9Y9Z7_9ACTN|nr:hypothetical protein [Actinomadura rudentiformis]KAB2340411.1 hypothetical protein F8566_45330 [Actinomadura rudentiformis]
MTVAIATAMAGKAVEVASEPVRAAVAEISRRVRERFRGEPTEENVQRVLDEDPEFRAELEAIWASAQTQATATADGVVNVFNGSAEKSIQLRDVHGDLNIS